MRVINSNSTNSLHNKLENSKDLELSQLSKNSKSIEELRFAIEELTANKPVQENLELDSKLDSEHSSKGGITSSDLQGIINIEMKIRNFIIEGFKEVFSAVKNLFKDYVIDGKTSLEGATKNK